MTDDNNNQTSSNKDDDILREILGDELLREILGDNPIPEPIIETPEVEDDVDKDMKIHVTRPPIPISYYGDEDENLDDYDDYEQEAPRRRLSTPIRMFLYILGVLVCSITLAIGVWYAADDVLALTKPDRIVEVTINEGDSVRIVAQKLKDAGLVNNKLLFQIYGGLSKASDKIDPGAYKLNNIYDYRALVMGMQYYESPPEIVTVVIPEGYEQKQIFVLLEENGVATVAALSQVAAEYDFDYDFLDGLEPGLWNRLEGYLFPDTYDFYMDEDPVSVINKFLANFDRRFDDTIKAQIPVLNEWIADRMTEMYSNYFDAGELQADIEKHMLTERDVIIIASLIEKEAANNSERSKISSVIHNRLMSKLYPALQIDATIQYVLDERKAVLTYDDQNIDSPYNTYTNAGLPIGPIANPGMASIRAVLYPDETDYYFYALDNDGTHQFFETSYEHTNFVRGLTDDSDE